MSTQLASAVKTRVLIVDDHPVVRAGLTQLLAGEPNLEVCGEAGNAGEALQLIREKKPHIALIDISLENGSGIELIKQIKALDGDIRMLAVSMHDDLLYAERALRAGAMGYINKQEVTERIVKAIQDVKREKIYVNERVSTHLLHRAVNGSGQVVVNSPVESLSDRELEVFEMVGKGMKTSEIAQKLFLSLKTIETHRENIKAKLKLHNANELIRSAVQWSMESA